MLPTTQCPAKGAGLDGIVPVLDIGGRVRSPTGEPVGDHRGHRARGPPPWPARRWPHLRSGRRPEAGHQLSRTVLVESLFRPGEESPTPIEGVGLAAAVAERFVLNPTPAFVELGVGGWDRTGARCQHLGWSVSPARPPNRTCGFHRIRLSTSAVELSGHARHPSRPTARGSLAPR